MLIIHFSKTPLAAAPFRLCEALNLLHDVQARSVVLDDVGYYKLGFPVDLVWKNDRKEILELVEKADLLHLHNYVDLNCTDFSPIDFNALWNDKKPLVRQFHSSPELISSLMKITEKQLANCPIPKLVIAQFQERYYPQAKVIPNIVTQFKQSKPNLNNPIRIGYSPSNFRTSREKRWDTKGYRETKIILNKFVGAARKQGLDIELDIMERVSFEECLERKSQCDIFIDDLVTGSYHMSTLEGLASGTVVLTFADNRVVEQTMEINNGKFLPIINTKLEELYDILQQLTVSRSLLNEFKQHTYEWMQRYWQPEDKAKQYIAIYQEVIANPRIEFPMRYNAQLQSDVWLAIEQFDVVWKTRHKFWPKESHILIKKIRLAVYLILERLGIK